MYLIYYIYLYIYICLFGEGVVKYADALSKWVIFKAKFKDLAGEEGKNKGKQREREG